MDRSGDDGNCNSISVLGYLDSDRNGDRNSSSIVDYWNSDRDRNSSPIVAH